MIRGDALPGVGVDLVKRIAQALRPAVIAGFLAAFPAAPGEAASPGSRDSSAPLSGVLHANGVPLAGASLVYAPSAFSAEEGITVEERRDAWFSNVPLKAKISTAEDVAKAALFLASDDARTITGQSINVDAGLYMVG